MNLNVQGFAMRGDIQALDLIDDLPRFYFMEDITDIQVAEIEQG
jgi:hypothetical protein